MQAEEVQESAETDEGYFEIVVDTNSRLKLNDDPDEGNFEVKPFIWDHLEINIKVEDNIITKVKKTN